MRKTILFALALSGLTAACIKPDPISAFTPAWEPFEPDEEHWESSQKVLLISDCQIHNLYSNPLPDRNLSAKAAVGTAIRSPQLDLFSRDVLGWVTQNGAPDAELILHLGDALDLACEGEWERFVEVMEKAGRPWFMAPGNHDSFYFGTYDPQHPELWVDACRGAGNPLRKDRFIRQYVGALLRQREVGIDAFADSLGLAEHRSDTMVELGERIPPEYEWHAPDGLPGYLASIAWKIDEEEPWRSFIIQAIDFTGPGRTDLEIRAILMDSCQYTRRPELVPNGWRSYPVSVNTGSAGQMLPNQLRLIREWVEDAPDRNHTLVSHHPFDVLSAYTRSSLGWLWRESKIAALVTAHTHRGYYKHHDLGGDSDRLELNIASTTDWPMEWRSLQGYRHKDRTRGYIRSERFTLVEELSNEEGFFLEGWEVPLGAPDDYRKYKQGLSERSMYLDFYIAFHLVPYWLPQPRVRAGRGALDTEHAIKNTLLWTYLRLLQRYPTAEGSEPPWPPDCASDSQVMERIVATLGADDDLDLKIDLLIELDRFERSRTSADLRTGDSTDDERTRFKVSQAAWASRFEKAQGRRLSVEDELIRVEAPRKSAQTQP